MSGKRRHPVPAPLRKATPAADRAALRFSGQMVRMEHLPPELLERFNEVVPGSARELLDSTLAETLHRRKLETDLMAARNASVAYRDKSAFKSDVLGQTFGFALSLCCVGAALAIAWFKPEMWKVAVAIVAMPALTVGVKVVIDSRHFRKTKSGGPQG